MSFFFYHPLLSNTLVINFRQGIKQTPLDRCHCEEYEAISGWWGINLTFSHCLRLEYARNKLQTGNSNKCRSTNVIAR
ncbi:MAG TPA: hypothetical protein VEH58_06275, partial [Dehalococcoidales bacterium]|nr:hypothetical protein [Dehalococcoidales bacterium]